MVCSARHEARGVFTALHTYLWLQPKHAISHELLVTHATQMKSYVNASQKRSFEEQLAQRLRGRLEAVRVSMRPWPN